MSVRFGYDFGRRIRWALVAAVVLLAAAACGGYTEAERTVIRNTLWTVENDIGGDTASVAVDASRVPRADHSLGHEPASVRHEREVARIAERHGIPVVALDSVRSCPEARRGPCHLDPYDIVVIVGEPYRQMDNVYGVNIYLQEDVAGDVFAVSYMASFSVFGDRARRHTLCQTAIE